LLSPDVPYVYCAEVGPAVAVFLSAVVSSLGSLLARVCAMTAVSTAVDVSCFTCVFKVSGVASSDI
jgi:hypothetical protein